MTVPSPTAVTFPLSSTVATLGSEDVHVTFLSVALDGVKSTVSCNVSPFFVRLFLSDEMVTFVTGMSGVPVPLLSAGGVTDVSFTSTYATA